MTPTNDGTSSMVERCVVWVVVTAVAIVMTSVALGVI